MAQTILEEKNNLERKESGLVINDLQSFVASGPLTNGVKRKNVTRRRLPAYGDNCWPSWNKKSRSGWPPSRLSNDRSRSFAITKMRIEKLLNIVFYLLT